MNVGGDCVVRAGELKALRERALDAWYGGAKPVSPHGRRRYGHDRPEYLTENHAPILPLPVPAAGQAALRAILQGWRGDGASAGSGERRGVRDREWLNNEP